MARVAMPAPHKPESLYPKKVAVIMIGRLDDYLRQVQAQPMEGPDR